MYVCCEHRSNSVCIYMTAWQTAKGAQELQHVCMEAPRGEMTAFGPFVQWPYCGIFTAKPTHMQPCYFSPLGVHAHHNWPDLPVVTMVLCSICCDRIANITETSVDRFVIVYIQCMLVDTTTNWIQNLVHSPVQSPGFVLLWPKPQALIISIYIATLHNNIIIGHQII